MGFMDKNKENKKESKKDSKPEQRFKKMYSQGIIDMVEIMIDTKTGVNYLLVTSSSSSVNTLKPK